jgi:hypothetical protein
VCFKVKTPPRRGFVLLRIPKNLRIPSESSGRGHLGRYSCQFTEGG